MSGCDVTRRGFLRATECPSNNPNGDGYPFVLQITNSGELTRPAARQAAARQVRSVR